MASQDEAASSKVGTRRTVIMSLAILPGLVGAWLWPKRERTGSKERAIASGPRVSRFRVGSKARSLMVTYPQPHWLPQNFYLASVVECSTGPKGPFKGADSAAQLLFEAHDATRRDHNDAINSGLFIAIAPAEELLRLRGATGEATPLEMLASDGTKYLGHYYDGATNGRRQWDQTLGHSVTLLRSGFVIGVSSFRKNRLDKDALIRVASSVG